MKYIVVLADGVSDHPIAKLGGKTPLMAANTPHIDRLCRLSRTGRLVTVPEGYKPGSEVANLGVLGYRVEEVYQGRAVLEAASMGIEVGQNQLALRCNLINVTDGCIKNHSAGHITSAEAAELIAFLNLKLGSADIRFFPGVSYRHLLVLNQGSAEIDCTPPHDVPGTPVNEVLIRARTTRAQATEAMLNSLIIKSQQLLPPHPVNIRRQERGLDIANSIWPWSPGFRPTMKTFAQLYGIERGAVISAVDLIQGIGVYAGFDVIRVEGATGLYDTNYEGKTQAVLDALGDHDFVYLHIEASDEAGHEGDVELKIRTIEYLDDRVIKRLLEATSQMNEPVAIALLPDHPTPCELRTHTREAVPFLMYHPGVEPDTVTEYNEFSVAEGSFGTLHTTEFIARFLGR